MSDDTFEDLNTKILSGSASDQERARWEELKSDVYPPSDEHDQPRKHARGPVAVEVRFDSTKKLSQAYFSFDLGAGGFGLELPDTYEVDTELVLELTLPGDAEAISIRSRVAWTGDAGVVGFQFLDLDPKLRNRIDALVLDKSTKEEWGF